MERRTQCKWGETEKNQMKYPVFQVIPQKLNTMCHPWGKVSRHHTWCPLTPAPGCMVHCPLPPLSSLHQTLPGDTDWGHISRESDWLTADLFSKGFKQSSSAARASGPYQGNGEHPPWRCHVMIDSPGGKNTVFFRHTQKVSFVSGWGFCPKMDIYQLWEMTESGLRDLAWLRVSCDEIVHTQCAGECG